MFTSWKGVTAMEQPGPWLWPDLLWQRGKGTEGLAYVVRGRGDNGFSIKDR